MWRLEDHTADALIVVEAADWPSLLEEAVQAFAAFVAGAEPEPRPLRRMLKIEIGAPTAEEAWVQWWRKLLRLWSVEGLLAVNAGVRLDATPERTHAVLRCIPAEELDQGALSDVKAITRHRAAAEAAPGGWSGRIILDV
jgi:SHS2 domain-containing protein